MCLCQAAGAPLRCAARMLGSFSAGFSSPWGAVGQKPVGISWLSLVGICGLLKESASKAGMMM